MLNMGNIRARPNEGPILNFKKRLDGESLDKKFGTHVEKFMVFKTLKNLTVYFF